MRTTLARSHRTTDPASTAPVPADVLAAIVASSADAIVSADLDGIITSWNPGAERLFGYTAEEALGRPLVLLVPDDGLEDLAAGIGRVRAGEVLADATVVRRRRDGSSVEVSVSVSPLRCANGRIVGTVAVTRDLTPRRRAEETERALEAARVALADAERLYRSVVEALDEGVVIRDVDGVIVAVNRSARRLLGCEDRDVVGRRYLGLTVTREDGTPLAEDEHAWCVTLRTGRPVDDLLFEVERPDGTVRWVELNAQPLTSSDGRTVTGVVTSFRDVSEQLEARQELERYAARLEEANAEYAAAASVRENLLSVASHELRTPLTPIIGFADVLSRQLADAPEPVHRQLGAIQRNARKMLQLVDELLVVSRATAGVLHATPVEVCVGTLVAEVFEELGDDLPDVEVRVDADLRCLADRDHLRQVLANLLTNAAKYGAPPFGVEGHRVPEGVEIAVVDHGAGVDEAFVPHLFERFTQASTGSTRTAKGVGLGLSIVELLTTLSGGSVSYRRNVPTGARFAVVLPSADQPAGATRYTSPPNSAT